MGQPMPSRPLLPSRKTTIPATIKSANAADAQRRKNSNVVSPMGPTPAKAPSSLLAGSLPPLLLNNTNIRGRPLPPPPQLRYYIPGEKNNNAPKRIQEQPQQQQLQRRKQDRVSITSPPEIKIEISRQRQRQLISILVENAYSSEE